jgi:hypothetical protein
MRTVHRLINAALGQELLDRIAASPPEFFERLIVALLLAMGFGGAGENAGRAIGRSETTASMASLKTRSGSTGSMSRRSGINPITRSAPVQYEIFSAAWTCKGVQGSIRHDIGLQASRDRHG